MWSDNNLLYHKSSRVSPVCLAIRANIFRADLFAIMKCENVVGPTDPGKNAMRGAGLPFDRPTNAKQGSEDLTGFGRRPTAHGDTANTSLSSGISSP